MPTHELNSFLQHATDQIEFYYQMITARVKEDPGTAGDQGEEDWAELLRQWLPPAFHVVTKGRILGSNGMSRGQIDIIILHPSYPTILRNRKHYLADGVLACFECKTTFDLRHTKKFFKRSFEIKTIQTARRGTPHRELFSPIIYGLLAHSHNIRRTKKKSATDKLYDQLVKCDKAQISHPREMPDLVCVADLGMFNEMHSPTLYPMLGTKDQDLKFDPQKSMYLTGYIAQHSEVPDQSTQFTPIGCALAHLMYRLAWEYPDLQRFAHHVNLVVGRAGEGKGFRDWDLKEILTDGVRHKWLSGKVASEHLSMRTWDEWSPTQFG